MFDHIYKRYDLLNRLFSLGQDIRWRRHLSRLIDGNRDRELLDLATGTGDVAFSLLKHNPGIAHAFGCDMAWNMLRLGKQKAVKKNLCARIGFLQGDANHVPFLNDTFDVVTMAFGIRNVSDPGRVLDEIWRVLKKEGSALILEFSLPANTFLRKFHLFYLRYIIPPLGALISRDKYAYRYLGQTIESFPYGDSFGRSMQAAGFRRVSFTPLTFGVVTIYRGEK
jgi:demethylmenaquinone methyltransferase/2-methoxy-6-polyprenyl-1,4-benzoquinol methylase